MITRRMLHLPLVQMTIIQFQIHATQRLKYQRASDIIRYKTDIHKQNHIYSKRERISWAKSFEVLRREIKTIFNRKCYKIISNKCSG